MLLMSRRKTINLAENKRNKKCGSCKRSNSAKPTKVASIDETAKPKTPDSLKSSCDLAKPSNPATSPSAYSAQTSFEDKAKTKN